MEQAVNIQELEYKFKADHISLQDFSSLMDKLGYKKKLETSSWDIYYTQTTESDFFQRLRLSEVAPELTKKRKLNENNNWERVEVDLPLDPKRASEALVTKFLSLDGYVKNFKIYKSCFIYWQEHVNFVYYVVYNEEMQEIGRYIEAEVNKDQVDLLENPFLLLNDKVKHLESIGLNPKTRLKRSLFEIYRKL